MNKLATLLGAISASTLISTSVGAEKLGDAVDCTGVQVNQLLDPDKSIIIIGDESLGDSSVLTLNNDESGYMLKIQETSKNCGSIFGDVCIPVIVNRGMYKDTKTGIDLNYYRRMEGGDVVRSITHYLSSSKTVGPNSPIWNEIEIIPGYHFGSSLVNGKLADLSGVQIDGERASKIALDIYDQDIESYGELLSLKNACKK